MCQRRKQKGRCSRIIINSAPRRRGNSYYHIYKNDPPTQRSATKGEKRPDKNSPMRSGEGSNKPRLRPAVHGGVCVWESKGKLGTRLGNSIPNRCRREEHSQHVAPSSGTRRKTIKEHVTPSQNKKVDAPSRANPRKRENLPGARTY